jgi:predicted amidophosphoribosyltransferase
MMSVLPTRPHPAVEPRRKQWDGDHFFALDYPTGLGNAGEDRRVLVRAFKAADPGALRAARRLFLGGLLARERQLCRGRSRYLLVPVPGHRLGPAGAPLHRLCVELGSAMPWLVYDANLLVRKRHIRQSSTSAFRPTIQEHLDSLACTHAIRANPVIMVDDVFTFGRTSDACKQVLSEAGAKGVVVACLALATA